MKAHRARSRRCRVAPRVLRIAALAALGGLAAACTASSSAAAPRGARFAARAPAATGAAAVPTAKASTSRDAGAGPSPEARARGLGRRTMEGSFASGDLFAARAGLDEALAVCGEKGCAPSSMAALQRDRAVCDAALGRADEDVLASLTEAVRLDASITLEAHRRTPRLVRLYERAKRSVLGAPPAATAATLAVSPPPPPSDVSAAEMPGPAARPRRVWVGVEGSLDVAFVSSAADVCSQVDGHPVNAGYACTTAGDDYPGAVAADAPQRGQLNSVAGGPTLGSTRIKLRLDFALDQHWLIGARAGYVFGAYGGDSASFAPIDLEARVTYLIGKHTLEAGATSQYVYLGAGLTETSANVDVDVVDRSGRVRTVQAWQLGGLLYAAGGLGVRVALASNVGVLIGPRFTLPLAGGTHLPAIAAEVGMHLGF